MRKSWGVNKDRLTFAAIVSFYFVCCLLVVADPAARQMGPGAKFGLVMLSMTFGILLLTSTVVEEIPPDEEDEHLRRP